MILDPEFSVLNDSARNVCFEGIQKVYDLDTKIH